MALADRITNAPPAGMHGKDCSIGALYATLEGDKAEVAALDRILYELGWSASQVWEALRAEGHEVGRQSVNRHRGRKCRCFKAAA